MSPSPMQPTFTVFSSCLVLSGPCPVPSPVREAYGRCGGRRSAVLSKPAAAREPLRHRRSAWPRTTMPMRLVIRWRRAARTARRVTASSIRRPPHSRAAARLPSRAALVGDAARHAAQPRAGRQPREGWAHRRRPASSWPGPPLSCGESSPSRRRSARTGREIHPCEACCTGPASSGRPERAEWRGCTERRPQQCFW